MKKHLFILIMAGLGINARAQVDNFINNRNFDWTKWEQVNPGSERQAFLSQLSEKINGNQNDEAGGNYYLVDINGDQVADAIFTNNNDKKPKTIFYLNIGSDFEVILELKEKIINIGRNKPWNPINFQTATNYGQNNKMLRSYTFSFKDGDLSFNLQNAILVDNNLFLINENLPPFSFELIENTELQLSPRNIDGNIIGNFSKGEKGFAIASAGNKADQTWWLVMIKVDKNVYRLGWMLRQNLRSLIADNLVSN